MNSNNGADPHQLHQLHQQNIMFNGVPDFHRNNQLPPSITGMQRPIVNNMNPMNNNAFPNVNNKIPEQTAPREVKYGLLGLLDIIKNNDKDISSLSLGIDINSFGLNLNSTESLYPYFR